MSNENIYCAYYFSCCHESIPDKNQLKAERVDFDWQIQEVWSIMMGMAGQELELLATFHPQSGNRVVGREDLSPQWLASSSKAPPPAGTASLTGDHIFKHMSLLGVFQIQSIKHVTKIAKFTKQYVHTFFYFHENVALC